MVGAPTFERVSERFLDGIRLGLGLLDQILVQRMRITAAWSNYVARKLSIMNSVNLICYADRVFRNPPPEPINQRTTLYAEIDLCSRTERSSSLLVGLLSAPPAERASGEKALALQQLVFRCGSGGLFPFREFLAHEPHANRYALAPGIRERVVIELDRVSERALGHELHHEPDCVRGRADGNVDRARATVA